MAQRKLTYVDLLETSKVGPLAEGYEFAPSTAPASIARPSFAALVQDNPEAPAPAPTPKAETREERNERNKREILQRTRLDRPLTGDPNAPLVDRLMAPPRAAAQVLSIGAIDEAVGHVGAGVGKIAEAVGLSEPKPYWDRYRDNRNAYRAQDTAAEKANPVGSAYGSVGASAIPLSAAANVTSRVARVALPAVEGAATGFGMSKAELTPGKSTAADKKQALKDTGLGLGLGAIGSVVQAFSSRAPKQVDDGRLKGDYSEPTPAEKDHAKQVTRDIAHGATPTHKRRAVGNEGPDGPVMDLVNKDTRLRKAVSGDRAELEAEAQRILNERAPQTTPIYQQFDKHDGLIPVDDMVAFLRKEIIELGQETNTKTMRGVLQDHIDDLTDVTKSRGVARSAGTPGVRNVKPKWTYKEVRKWVTDLLKQETQTMGSIAETERFGFKSDAHDIGDRFLKERLEQAAAKHAAELGEAYARIKPLNRDISAAARIKEVAENAQVGERFKEPANLLQRMKSMAGNPGVIGAVAGSASGSVAGSAAGAFSTWLAAVGFKAGNRASVRAAGRLVAAAKAGSPAAKLVQETLDAGVPEAVVREILDRRRRDR